MCNQIRHVSPRFFYLRFTRRPCPNYLVNVNNMLIQNGIACIDVSEKIDSEAQLSHFLETFEGYAT